MFAPIAPLWAGPEKNIELLHGFCMPKKVVERTKNFQPIEMRRDAEPHTKDDKQHT